MLGSSFFCLHKLLPSTYFIFLNIIISDTEADRKWSLLVVPLKETSTLENISFQELEMRYEVNLQVVAGGDEKRCK